MLIGVLIIYQKLRLFSDGSPLADDDEGRLFSGVCSANDKDDLIHVQSDRDR